jgi:hypothetical protein
MIVLLVGILDTRSLTSTFATLVRNSTNGSELPSPLSTKTGFPASTPTSLSFFEMLIPQTGRFEVHPVT